jgi:osmoprotectant transport system substrate-binding protein
MRPRWVGVVALAGALASSTVGCTARPPAARSDPARQDIRIASYDFSENETLAHVYAEALRRRGLAVEVIEGIGTREVVQPALQQDRVDIVIDYLGTALSFLESDRPRTAGANAVRAALEPLLAERGIAMTQHARAQDQNGFAVTTEFARRHRLTTLSDLKDIAPNLKLGGPPECPSRPYCLLGLQRTYQLAFEGFQPIESRSATVSSLVTGEIDVGMLETTDARLAGGELVLLVDDRGLQPNENIVPLVRTDVLARRGPVLRATLDDVSARLSTAEVIGLNRAVEVDGLDNDQAAAEWVRRNIAA